MSNPSLFLQLSIARLQLQPPLCVCILLPHRGKGYKILTLAKVAELVDARDLGSSALRVGVQIPPFAPAYMAAAQHALA